MEHALKTSRDKSLFSSVFLIWLDCSSLGLSHEALAHFFYYEAKLGLNDGKSFGQVGEGFMRLNVGTGREVLEEAMQRLLKAVKGLDA